MNKRGVGVRNRLSGIFVGFGIISLTFIGLNTPAHAETTLSVSTPSDPILEVSLSSNLVQLDLMPKPNSPVFKSSNLIVTVGTNNPYGYSLYMDVDNTNLTRTQTIDNATPVIASLANNEGGYTEAGFTTNRWGYRLDEGNYFAIPSIATLLNSNESQINQDITTITFASKVDMNQQSGIYNTNIDIVATANPMAMTMQNVDTWKGSLMANQSVQVEDLRDGKTYWVTKLQTADANPRVKASVDGKKYQIWMTQNLDYDLSTSKPLTSELSDLNSSTGIYTNGYTNNNGVISWTPVRDTTTSASYTTNDNNTPYSYDRGDVYLSPSACNESECNHWHAGNYYNYSAVVASNNTSSLTANYTEAQNSICPKGWKLPAGATAANEYSDLNYLLVQNNIISGYGIGSNIGFSSNGSSNIQKAPLYIVYSGYLANGSFRASDGHMRTSTSSDGSHAYAMGLSSSYWSEGGYDRYYGFPARCIARYEVKITFDANGGTGIMAPQNVNEAGGLLNPNTFTRSNHAFTGWNTKADGSGDSYSDGGKYAGPSTTLYAQWIETKTINDLTYLQDFASLSEFELGMVKDSIKDSTIYQLKDSRDEKVYKLTKINDVIWLSTNLNIAGGTTLTPEKSNVTRNYTLPESSTSGFNSGNRSTPYVYNDDTYGGYYSYAAATAGTNPSTGDAPEDICPAGWKMPNVGTLTQLMNSFSNGAALAGAPWYGTFSSSYSNSSISGIGQWAYYWASTSYNTDDAYFLYFEHGTKTIYNSGWKSVGENVRCIAK